MANAVSFSLIGPELVFVSVHFCPCLLAADYRTVENCLFELLIERGCFLGKSADMIVNAAFTQVNPIGVFQKFLQPVIKEILPAVQVTYQAFYPNSVLYGCADVSWVGGFVFFSTGQVL
jgi:hypothetical protein